ncbi:MAG: pilus assembly FimT family protein [Prosthecobacter sp.]
MTDLWAITKHRELAPLIGRKSHSIFQSSFSNHQFSFPRRRSAFTLIELVLSMTITILVIGVATLSISGVRDEDRLRRAAAIIETSARQNLLQALSTQQTVRFQLTAGAFNMGGEFGGMLQIKRVGENAFRAPKRGEAWEFSPTGICEPIEVRVTGPAGAIELAFDPLTACARRKSIQIKG